MSLIVNFYSSTIGKKVAMALSGVVLVLFVVGHMAGNLKIFAGINPATGDYKIDDYGRFLRTMGSEMLGESGVLWIVRVVLLACLVIHAVSGILLAKANRSAKPEGYKVKSYRSANAASLTMLYGGLFLLLFVTFHILHFTTGTVHWSFVEGDVYANVWSAFQNLLTAGFYVVAMALLALHLYHGTWSMFQTLGVDTPRWNKGLRTVAKVVAVALFVGFSAVPVSIATGLLSAPVTTANAK
ncbi:MAG: succinate dehydrogenase cytochrome b subunit [Pseudomonadota bacterium]|jgi:succinate dehydrogenase / fumarate reductase cytochrome b subunit